MKLKRLLTTVVFASVAFILAACSNQSQSDGKTVVKVATDSDTAPFTFKENDNFKGYDILTTMKSVLKSTFFQTQFHIPITPLQVLREQAMIA